MAPLEPRSSWSATRCSLSAVRLLVRAMTPCLLLAPSRLVSVWSSWCISTGPTEESFKSPETLLPRTRTAGSVNHFKATDSALNALACTTHSVPRPDGARSRHVVCARTTQTDINHLRNEAGPSRRVLRWPRSRAPPARGAARSRPSQDPKPPLGDPSLLKSRSDGVGLLSLSKIDCPSLSPRLAEPDTRTPPRVAPRVSSPV